MFSKKVKNYTFDTFARLMFRLALATFAAAIFTAPTVAQDDEDTVSGKVMDAANRSVGKAELVLDTGDVKTNFGYNIKMWLEGNSKLRIVRPQSGSRGTGINSSFREYKVDPKNPKDSSRWDETGSGTAMLQMPATGEVSKISTSMTLTKKFIGDDEVAIKDKAQKFVIVLD